MIKSIFLTMIQRIQSFYLFLVAALVLSMLFMPLAGYSNADGNWQFLAMEFIQWQILHKWCCLLGLLLS